MFDKTFWKYWPKKFLLLSLYFSKNKLTIEFIPSGWHKIVVFQESTIKVFESKERAYHTEPTILVSLVLTKREEAYFLSLSKGGGESPLPAPTLAS